MTAHFAGIQEVTADVSATLDRILDYRGDQSELISRPPDDCQLDSQTPADMLARSVGIDISCVAFQRVDSPTKRWSAGDLQVFQTAVALFGQRVAEFRKFDGFLADLGTDDGNRQFKIWSHLLDVWLSIDQILVTRVRQFSDRFVIEADPDLHTGFSGVETVMSSNPKTLPIRASRTSEDLDIMSRILSDYLEGNRSAESVYRGSCSAPDMPGLPYVLDASIIRDAKLRGNIYFVPCYSEDEDGVVQLRSILHLGASGGGLEISESQYPLLMLLGNRVAKLLEEQELADLSQATSRIRDTTDLNAQSAVDILAEVCESTQTLGGTFFTNICLLHLVGSESPPQELLEDVLGDLFKCVDKWEELFESGMHAKLLNMISSFLGLENEDAKRLMRTEPLTLSRMTAKFLYVRVAQFAGRSHPTFTDDFAAVLKKRSSNLSDGLQIVAAFGHLLASECYLPGYGLTGWILRYQSPLTLRSKRPDEIAKRVRPGLFKRTDPVGKHAVLNGLKYLGIAPGASSLSKLSTKVPIHQNHLPDHSENCIDDHFFGVPLPPLGASEFPSGLIRFSSLATIRPHFTRRVRDLVHATASHLASLLNAAMMSQQSYLEREINQKSFGGDHIHTLKRFVDELSTLKQLIGVRDTDPMLHFAISRLSELCEKGLARDEHSNLALSILRDPRMRWPVEDFAAFVNEWFETTKLQVNDRVAATSQREMLPKQFILPCCQVLEEVVRNYRRYGADGGIWLHFTSEAQAFVYSDTDSLDRTMRRSYTSYETLCPNGRGGGGMKFIKRICEDTQMEVYAAVAEEGMGEAVKLIFPIAAGVPVR